MTSDQFSDIFRFSRHAFTVDSKHYTTYWHSLHSWYEKYHRKQVTRKHIVSAQIECHIHSASQFMYCTKLNTTKGWNKFSKTQQKNLLVIILLKLQNMQSDVDTNTARSKPLHLLTIQHRYVWYKNKFLTVFNFKKYSVVHHHNSCSLVIQWARPVSDVTFTSVMDSWTA